MNLTLKQKIGAVFVAILALFGVGTTAVNNFGGLNDATYYATTTNGTAQVRQLKSSAGQLGRVIVTKTDTGTTAFYDATTSNANLRASSMATSSIIRVLFPTGATAGDYTLEASFDYGILMVTTGAPASSTVTWK